MQESPTYVYKYPAFFFYIYTLFQLKLLKNFIVSEWSESYFKRDIKNI